MPSLAHCSRYETVFETCHTNLFGPILWDFCYFKLFIYANIDIVGYKIHKSPNMHFSFAHQRPEVVIVLYSNVCVCSGIVLPQGGDLC